VLYIHKREKKEFDVLTTTNFKFAVFFDVVSYRTEEKKDNLELL